jgi:hypothetical protein
MMPLGQYRDSIMAEALAFGSRSGSERLDVATDQAIDACGGDMR